MADSHRIELTFVDNASTDRTPEFIKELRARDRTVQLITHSRNFGYQASLLCGLTNLDGDAYVIIDGDCEDPPELIPEFVKKWEEGYDLVYGDRKWRSENAAVATGGASFTGLQGTLPIRNLSSTWRSSRCSAGARAMRC